ncbi:MAG: cytochrome c-type biogenesis protein CcmH [Aquirhabdus sp.]
MRITPAAFFLTLIFGLLSTSIIWAADADLTFESTAQETQYRTLIDEFRCPKCQNANLAGSDAPIAQDLKHKTYELVKQGQSNEQIRTYMISRYGDFISYKPPIKRSTWLLWFAPPLILLLSLIGWFVRMRARRATTTAPLSAEESWRLNQVLNDESKPNEKQELGDDR